MKKTTMKFTTLFLLLAFLIQTASAQFDSEINQRIRNEGKNNSQIMKTIQVLTDVYGPRLTGSPQLKASGEWAANQMKTWGFDETRLEPWDFGNVGWVNERASGFITSPVQDSLVFEVLAWTPSTKKTVKGQAFQIILPERPTQDELTAYFNSIKDKIKGNMVLMGKPVVL
ncbi:MAG TPA: hypothetical protein PKE69_26750, partial [Pyrinomonadaceae bacterium]|nr:hypothetical protein [Pyrinomonadaceae bacterium]